MKQRTAVQNNMLKKAKEMFQKCPEQKLEEILEQNNWDIQKALPNLAGNGEKKMSLEQQLPLLAAQNPQMLQQMMNGTQQTQKTFLELEKLLKQIPQHVWHSDRAEQILKKLETENQEEDASLNNRVISLPVGVKNVNNQTFFSCMIVILFQNPELIEKILMYRPLQGEDSEFEKSQKNFMIELQLLFAKLILTNQRYVNPQTLFLAAQDYFRKCEEEVKGQSLPQFYEIMLKCIDLGLTNTQIVQKDECPLKELCQQYCAKLKLKQDEVCMRKIEINPVDNFLFCSLVNQISQENKFEYFPKNLVINIRRTLQVDKKQKIFTHVDSDYWFPKKINLDFLTGERVTSEIKKYMEKSATDLKNVQTWQEMLNDITIVLSTYEQQTIVPGDVIRSLKQEQQGLLDKLKKVFPRNQDNNNIQQHISQLSKNTYFLNVLGIQILRNEEKQYYLYVYNFHTNQWFMHNGKQVKLESEEFVMNDATKNACFIMYVNQELKEKIFNYQKLLQDIESKVQINHGKLQKDDYQSDTLLGKIPKTYTSLIHIENDEFSRNQ